MLNRLIHFLVVILLPLTCARGHADGWAFDWNVRTDRDGRPAGIYTQTPYPIDEHTTSYTIVNDDGDITYHLGTKYFVDGGYTGGNTDGSWSKPWTTIAQALSSVGTGNNTIVIRGAHGGFNGTYHESGLSLQSGLDDAQRFMLVGYGQERPIIDGDHSSAAIIKTSFPDAIRYSTVQRLRVQESWSNGVRTDGNDAYISVIDVWLYHNNRWDGSPLKGDGNLYFLGTDHTLIRHCTSERTYGHAYKIGDGADKPTVEWSIARDFGWWAGDDVGPTTYFNAHPSGFDFPNDNSSYVQRDIRLRYNIAEGGLFYAIQIRTQTHGGHIIKFNEISNTTHFDDVDGAASHALLPSQVLLFTCGSTEFHNNVVRNGGDRQARGVYVTSCQSGTINMYNNIVYGHHENIRVRNCSALVNCFNNSLYNNNGQNLIDSTVGDSFSMINNILFQEGPGTCASIGSGSHSYNVYYAPGGSAGISLGQGESIQSPNWVANPSGPYQPEFCRLQEPLQGTSLSAMFNTDFNGALRATWDMGAYEFSQSEPDQMVPMPPNELRIAP